MANAASWLPLAFTLGCLVFLSLLTLWVALAVTFDDKLKTCSMGSKGTRSIPQCLLAQCPPLPTCLLSSVQSPEVSQSQDPLLATPYPHPHAQACQHLCVGLTQDYNLMTQAGRILQEPVGLSESAQRGHQERLENTPACADWALLEGCFTNCCNKQTNRISAA